MSNLPSPNIYMVFFFLKEKKMFYILSVCVNIISTHGKRLIHSNIEIHCDIRERNLNQALYTSSLQTAV